MFAKEKRHFEKVKVEKSQLWNKIFYIYYNKKLSRIFKNFFMSVFS